MLCRRILLAHRYCNVRQQVGNQLTINIYAHNGGRFDTILVYNSFTLANWKTNNVFVIGKSAASVQYIFITTPTLKAVFSDTLKFYPMSLEQWYSIVKGAAEKIEKDVEFYLSNNRIFLARWLMSSEEDKKTILKLLNSKTIIPYEMMKTGREVYNTVMPTEKDFMSKLKKTATVDELAYKNFVKIWEMLKIQTLGEMIQIYNVVDLFN